MVKCFKIQGAVPSYGWAQWAGSMFMRAILRDPVFITYCYITQLLKKTCIYYPIIYAGYVLGHNLPEFSVSGFLSGL